MGLYDGKTVLPVSVQRALDSGDERALIDSLGELPLALYHSVARDLAWRMNWQAPPVRLSRWGRLRAWFSAGKRTLRSPYPDLFHPSGYVREAALKRIVGPMPSAFFLVAIAYRLNDWVPEVRATATEALRRTSRYTGPAILAEALLFLLLRSRDWARWGNGKTPIDGLLDRPTLPRSSRPKPGPASLDPKPRSCGRRSGRRRWTFTCPNCCAEPASPPSGRSLSGCLAKERLNGRWAHLL